MCHKNRVYFTHQDSKVTRRDMSWLWYAAWAEVNKSKMIYWPFK